MADREERVRTDRISKLPEPLLQHILCFLSQKQAVKTCILSKSWRYLGSTRPSLNFPYWKYNIETFLSILGKTLQSYHDQKLCIQYFHVELLAGVAANPESVSFLDKWFPFIVAMMTSVKTFDLSFYRWSKSRYFDLPSEFFENSASLLKLRLRGFIFSQNLKVHILKHLQSLSLVDVRIVDETFHNIMSSCPYIEHVLIDSCKGLATIMLMNNNYLKSFDLVCSSHDNIVLIEELCLVDVPNLESMKIEKANVWFNFDHLHHKIMYFPALKTLKLLNLRLSTWRPSLDISSGDFPCLEHFYIEKCKGFDELRVSNHSITHITISDLDGFTKVVVDAPYLVLLNYSGPIPLDIFSFATTSIECVSRIMKPKFEVDSEDGFLGLSKLLEAVSQSKIYLKLPYYQMRRHNIDDKHDKPVLVEYLHLDCAGHEYFYSETFLNRMFRYCRPRNILAEEYSKQQDSRFLCKMFLFRENNNGSPYYHWQRDLEEASMQVRDKNSKEWHSVEGTTFFESSDCGSNYEGEVWFVLKWRK